MKDMSKEDWIKEARFLYMNLKEMHEMWTELQLQIQDRPTPTPKVIDQITEAIWVVYCVEKNIKPEDYEQL